MSKGSFKITWQDRKRDPQCPPNPKYPNGIDVDASNGAMLTCTAELPYPAKRCGVYEIQCHRCGIKIAVTTAGRVDDPKSVKIGCYSNKLNDRINFTDTI